MRKDNILLISGGTGGHVIPSVNFGNFLINNGHQCFLFLDERGIKYKSDFKGKIIKTGGPELALEVEDQGYTHLLLLINVIILLLEMLTLILIQVLLYY